MVEVWQQSYNVMTSTTTWTSWNHTYSITDEALANIAWTGWQTAGTGNTITNNMYYNGGLLYDAPLWPEIPVREEPAWQRWNTVAVETEEARLRRIAEQEIYNERLAERRREQDALRARTAQELAAAKARANELLMLFLTAEQKRQVLEFGYFDVVSSKGRRWRVRMGNLYGNVDLMSDEGDVRIASYCAHPPASEGLPYEDHHLAQKLSLEADEESFTNVAYLHYKSPQVEAEGIVIPLPDREKQRLAARVA